MGEHTHFTVVFERPDDYEDVHPQLCAEDLMTPCHGVRWEVAEGNLKQQRDELAKALRPIAERGEISADIINNARAALAKVRGE